MYCTWLDGGKVLFVARANAIAMKYIDEANEEKVEVNRGGCEAGE